MSECRLASPRTGQLCTMGRGHAGPHKAGGPYHSVEDWVTPCKDGCTYHGNRSWNFERTDWDLFEECIRCGSQRYESAVGEPMATVPAADRGNTDLSTTAQADNGELTRAGKPH